MPLSRVSTPILPARYDEVLNRRVAEQVQALVAAAKPTSLPWLRLPEWIAPALVVAAGIVAAATLVGKSSAPPRTGVAFAKTNLVSTGTVGPPASAADLIGPSPSPASPSSDPVPELFPAIYAPSADAGRTRHESGARRVNPEVSAGVSAGSPSLRPETSPPPRLRNTVPTPPIVPTIEPATEVLDENSGTYSADIPALPTMPERILTVGTRIRAKLTDSVVTSFSGTPVTALVRDDVLVGDQIAVPAGALLAGEAFGTNLDDRAQIAFSALVVAGHTISFRGASVGPDHRLGLIGRVVRRGSASKKGVGRLLGSVGSALTLGLAGHAGEGLFGNTGIDLAGGLAADLTQLDRTWTTERSDKAVAVAAGTETTVYLQSDVRVQ